MTIFARKYDPTADQWINEEISDETYPNRWEGVPLFVNELELQELKRAFQISNDPLEFDSDYILTPIQDHPNERPYYPLLALSVEKKHGLIVYSDMVKANNVVAATQEAFVGLIKQLNSIPSEIWIREEILPYLYEMAKKLNIQLIVAQELPLLEEAWSEMEMMMR